MTRIMVMAALFAVCGCSTLDRESSVPVVGAGPVAVATERAAANRWPLPNVVRNQRSGLPYQHPKRRRLICQEYNLWDDENCRWWTMECRSPRGVVKKTRLLRA